MAVRLRLTRRGKKKQPTYRVVAADSRFARDGRFIEILGFYDPRSEPSEIRIDSEKVLKWLQNGAQPSERVKKLLEISGVWTEFTTGKPAESKAAAPEGQVPKLTIVESDRPSVDAASSDETPGQDETPGEAGKAEEPAVEPEPEQTSAATTAAEPEPELEAASESEGGEKESEGEEKEES